MPGEVLKRVEDVDGVYATLVWGGQDYLEAWPVKGGSIAQGDKDTFAIHFRDDAGNRCNCGQANMNGDAGFYDGCRVARGVGPLAAPNCMSGGLLATLIVPIQNAGSLQGRTVYSVHKQLDYQHNCCVDKSFSGKVTLNNHYPNDKGTVANYEHKRCDPRINVDSECISAKPNPTCLPFSTQIRPTCGMNPCGF
jgi:hypothetical protein